ncbi:MAG: hypothetical protein Ct9H300mP6_11670 [Gammaproteobacteria bacterium]|nr:MAG: hypothetical protein Ct9H300mP6_11670 [Gammaproteobacteria bacterium]
MLLFVVDGREGLTNSDQEIAQRLRKKNKNMVLVINKTEGMDDQGLASDFYALGFKDTLSVSALRGDHCQSLVDLISESLTRESSNLRD